MSKSRFFFTGGMLLLLITVFSLLLWPVKADAPTAQYLLDTTLAASEYAYQSNATLYLNHETRDYYQINGSVSQEKASLCGRVLGSKVELRFEDNTIWQKVEDGPWQQHSREDIAAAAQLFAELLPKAAFTYSELTAFTDLGRDSDGQHLQFSVTPAGWVGKYFTDVTYTLHCDRRLKEIYRLELQARNLQNENAALGIEVSFYDL